MGSLKIDLPDIQNQEDLRGKKIFKVGIRNFESPIEIKDKLNKEQSTIGKFSIYTSLSEEVRGANMSRYVQIITKAIEDKHFALDAMEKIMVVLKERLESENSYLKIQFPFFIKKKAPTIDNYAFSKYDCILETRYQNGKLDKYLTVETYAMSLCPCSKEMSLISTATLSGVKRGEYKTAVGSGPPGWGAHNQRSLVRITVHMKEFIWIEDLIQIAEEESSCPIYNVLKRPDEKHVTEQSYNNPKFVEDTARDVAIRLDQLRETNGYVVVVENEESIHQFNAVAVIRGGDYFVP